MLVLQNENIKYS